MAATSAASYPDSRFSMTTSIPVLLRQFVIPLGIVSASALIQWLNLKELLQFDRELVQSGAFWRMLSGHFAHLGWVHFALNGIALFIIWDLFYRHKPLSIAVPEIGLLALGISVGLLLLNPEIGWYVGLSGILHGLLTIGACNAIYKKQMWALVVIAGLTLKLMWEQISGPMTTLLLNTDSVITQAHLYGAVTGLSIALTKMAMTKRRDTSQGPK